MDPSSSQTDNKVSAGDHLEAYLTRLRVEGKTVQTIASYQASLRRWKQSGMEPIPWLHSLTCSGISKHREYRHLRTFFAWLVDRGLLDRSPLEGLRMKLPKTLPRRASAQDIRQMLQAADSQRNRVMLVLAADSGLRALELARLRIEDVDLASRLLRVRRGKGDRERMSPFGPEAARLLRTFIKDRYAHGANPEDPLLSSHSGGFLSVSSISHTFQRIAHRAGLKAVGPHAFRHFAGTRLLELTGNLRLVQEFLGHSTIDMTLRYAKVTSMQLREKYRSPADDLL